MEALVSVERRRVTEARPHLGLAVVPHEDERAQPPEPAAQLAERARPGASAAPRPASPGPGGRTEPRSAALAPSAGRPGTARTDAGCERGRSASALATIAMKRERPSASRSAVAGTTRAATRIRNVPTVRWLRGVTGALERPASGPTGQGRPTRRAPSGRRAGYVSPSSGGKSSGWTRAAGLEAAAAARLVDVGRAHHDLLLRLGEALGVRRGRAAAGADRVHLLDVLGDRQQLRHRPERLAAEVHVEAGHDHPLAEVGQMAGDAGPGRRRRTAPRRSRRPRCGGRPGRGSPPPWRRAPPRAATGSATRPGPRRSGRRALLEDLDALARDDRPAQAPDQLLGFPREHAAGDHLDPAAPGVAWLHARGIPRRAARRQRGAPSAGVRRRCGGTPPQAGSRRTPVCGRGRRGGRGG